LSSEEAGGRLQPVDWPAEDLDRLSNLECVADGAPEDLLDAYERKRRPIARDDIVAQADKNRARMNATDPEARRAHLDELKRIADDPELSRAFLLRSSMIEGLRRGEAL
jgi:3-(3-hydroxy-phenyl)propionate hydroxylase